MIIPIAIMTEAGSGVLYVVRVRILGLSSVQCRQMGRSVSSVRFLIHNVAADRTGVITSAGFGSITAVLLSFVSEVGMPVAIGIEGMIAAIGEEDGIVLFGARAMTINSSAVQLPKRVRCG
jgi:hypothetical protein